MSSYCLSIFELLFSLLAQTYPNLVLITNFGELRRFVLFVLPVSGSFSPVNHPCRLADVELSQPPLLPLAPRSPVLRPCQAVNRFMCRRGISGTKSGSGISTEQPADEPGASGEGSSLRVTCFVSFTSSSSINPTETSIFARCLYSKVGTYRGSGRPVCRGGTDT